ncbi:MAG: hypothetical protein H0W58_06510 [Acidobacteria bacterium]|jgi:hypothetical protein|nr:hypothetical protein [Acidobacteriota bacterium]
MNTKNGKNWTAADWHPEDEVLLMSLDGELEAKETNIVRSHLDSCWSCRSRSERLQAGISAFMDYHDAVLTPLVTSSPDSWNNFGKHLQKAAETKKDVSRFRLLVNLFGAFQLKLDNVSLIRGVTASILIAAILTAFFLLRREQTVSASELLEKAQDAQKLESKAVFQPVVYQKVLLKKQVNGADTDALTLESWNDKLRLRNRTALADNDERKFIAEKIVFGKKQKGELEETLVPVVLLELKEILQKNRMDTVQPLSAQSFANWRNGANIARETVEKSVNADGAEVLTLRTNITPTAEKGLITSAEFAVRTRDWHPVKLKFDAQNDVPQSFELVETNFEIVSLSNLNPNILPSTETLNASTAQPKPSPLVSESPENKEEIATNTNADIAPTNTKTSAKPLIATAEQELEVLRVLQDVKADLGEQISLERRADGRLYVNGIVETAERKAELTRALQSVADNRTVKINIQTVSEAVAQEKQTKKPKSTAAPEEVAVTVDDNAQEIAPELRRYFEKRGDVETNVRKFSAQIVSRSRQTMSHAFALRNLANQFKAERVQNLSLEARGKWLNLVRARAQSYQAEAANLRGELQNVFPNSANGKTVSITNDTELFRAVERLFALASANDRAIRSAFSASGGANAAAPLRSAQFRQSLADAEALAASIAAAK